jgi:hypothetical protein
LRHFCCPHTVHVHLRPACHSTIAPPRVCWVAASVRGARWPPISQFLPFSRSWWARGRGTWNLVRSAPAPSPWAAVARRTAQPAPEKWRHGEGRDSQKSATVLGFFLVHRRTVFLWCKVWCKVDASKRIDRHIYIRSVELSTLHQSLHQRNFQTRSHSWVSIYISGSHGN